MPSRVIRGEIITSKSLSRVSELAELVFYKLLSTVDDYGRYDGDAEILAAHLYPRRRAVTTEMMESRLQELVSADGPGQGPIRFYWSRGKRYLHLPRWEKHRGKSRRGSQSRWPEPPKTDDSEAETQSTASPEIRGDPRGSAEALRDPPEVAGCRGSGVARSRGSEEVTLPPPSASAKSDSRPEGNGNAPKHPDAPRLAALLRDELTANVEDWTPPRSLRAWETVIGRMLRLDGPEHAGIPAEHIEETIRWLVVDEFESKNVQSASKLRKRFGALRAKANARASPKQARKIPGSDNVHPITGWNN